ncbi:MAG: carboxymethylenebutenolidase [Acidimicrobiia bacterium]|nr:MAG: carboxymethylenebutenolidase [Acidimicrobiia bacterium]
MRTGFVAVPTADGPMRVYEAVPGAGDGPTARGAVVVVQEAFGVNEHIQDVTARFAAAGYDAVAPELFHRGGDGLTGPYGDFARVLELFGSVPGDDAVLVDVDAALDHLRGRGHPDRRIAVVGFCFGGRVSFLVAARRALGAAVGFYGGGIVTARFPRFPPLVGEAAGLRTPWLGLFGDEDPSIPVEDVERLRAALAGAAVAGEVVRYAGAGHGFHCDARADHHPRAAADAWARTLAWLDRHLGAPAPAAP